MRLTLMSAEQARFAATARALLSPLDLPSVHAWRARVLAELGALLEADAGGFILESPGEPPYTLRNLPDAFAREYLESVAESERSRALIRELGGGIWSTRLLGERSGIRMPAGWYNSRDYRRFYRRYRIRDAIGFVALPDRASDRPRRAPPRSVVPESMLTCFRQVFGTEYFGTRGLELLRLLLPALEAGVTARMRLGGARHALEAAFDASAFGVAVYRLGQRRPWYRNAAFGRILDGEPAAVRLRASLTAGIRALSALVRSDTGVVEEGLDGTSREIRTAQARYRIRVSLMGEGVFDGLPTLLATLERTSRDRPSVRSLRECFRLTVQEARVATLLARGSTNKQIALAMHLSPTTARHYTESLFAKLGVHRRAEATAKILLA